MRVLLVNAYPTGNVRSAERFDKFRQHVLRVVKELEKSEVTDVEVVERARNDVDDFLFEMHSEFVTPQSITNFDRLDFVLVDGDASALPWAPPLRKLALLTKMCMMTGKCLFASGIGAALLAYVCSTGGEHFHVLNNDGKGSLIENIEAIPPPSPPLPAPQQSASMHAASLRQQPLAPSTHANDVLLDTKSGDFFAFSTTERCWIPKGNTGLMLHSSDHARDYGARPNSARAGTKPAHRERLSHPLCLSKRGETKCCIRLELANHALFTSFAHREFIANCKSKWDLDEAIASTGSNRYRVLLDSSRGPMLIEFGNCIGSHFALSKEYPESCKLLRNFVLAKYEELKVHAHIDRSYVSAISGSSRLKDRLNQAQTKSVLHSTNRALAGGNTSATAAARQGSYDLRLSPGKRGVTASPPNVPNATTMTAGRTSPKRYRPVSAGPSRSASKITLPTRTIQTSRSAYPTASVHPPGDDCSAASARASFDSASSCAPLPSDTLHTVTAALSSTLVFAPRECGNNYVHEPPPASHHHHHQQQPCHATKLDAFASDRPEAGPPSADNQRRRTQDVLHVSSASNRSQQQRRVRVPQKNERERPYCAINKFNKLRDEEKQQFYSVVNDAPYVSAGEREALNHQKSKLKWTAGPFRTAIGKATTHAVPVEAGVFATAPFVQENTPFYIIQRRELELHPARREHTPPVQAPTATTAAATTGPRSQSRLPQRPKTASCRR